MNLFFNCNSFADTAIVGPTVDMVTEINNYGVGRRGILINIVLARQQYPLKGRKE